MPYASSTTNCIFSKNYTKPFFYKKHKVWKFLENDPIFSHSPTKRSLEEERKIIMQQTLRILDEDFLNEKKGEIGDPVKVNT